jgi:hypothetical protein
LFIANVALKALVWIQMLPADMVSHARQKFERFSAEFTFVSWKFGVLLKVLAEIIFFREHFSTKVTLE